jgi:hypothetical protein
MGPSPESENDRSLMPSYAGEGRFALRRIHLSEWLVALGGTAMVFGLLLPWADSTAGFESLSVLKVLVLIVGIAGMLLPVAVAFSSKTDLPMAWETLFAVAVSILILPLLVRLLLQPDGGLDTGFFTVLGGVLLCLAAGWRSVAREY